MSTEWEPPRASGGIESSPWEQGPPSEGPATAGAPEYAGWGARLGAVLLDGILVSAPFFILGLVLGLTQSEDALDDENDTLDLIITLASVILPFVYYALTMGRQGEHNGQTLGKQALGIRVVRESGDAVTGWWAVGRELVKGIIGTVTLLIDYLWPLWDKRNQALHDKAMSDLVVKL
jgi:uncharacterized RDD family membrane protein YckC